MMIRSRLTLGSDFSSFNMTPIIDIVFLLIIFFMLVCQFIVAENFEVNVPGDTRNAKHQAEQNDKITTLTVVGDGEEIIYAVGSEIITQADGDLVSKISAAIDAQLRPVRGDRKVVCLRMDKDVPYRKVQYVLSAVARSVATDIQLAVINEPVSQF